jgi:RND family efflux transporter MFP subunit
MDISQVVARAHIPQPEAALLNKGDHADVTVPGIDQALPGNIVLVSPALDPNSTTVEVWIQLKNPKERLRPGTSVQVAMVARSLPDALAIPAVALLTGQDGATTVMVAGSDSKAHRQPVKVGIRDGERVQIVQGLQDGERIVGSGAYGLPDNSPITPQSQPQEQSQDKG